MTNTTQLRRPKATAGYLLLLPATAVIALLVVVPTLVILRDSFAVSDPLGGNLGGFTLNNYAKLLNPVYAKTLGYSLGMAALNDMVCTVVGYILAYFIATRSARTQPVLLVLVIIPFLTDFLVRTFAWITLLGSGGPLIPLLRALGVETTSLVPSQLAVTLSLLYAFLPVAASFTFIRPLDAITLNAARQTPSTNAGTATASTMSPSHVSRTVVYPDVRVSSLRSACSIKSGVTDGNPENAGRT